MRTVVTVLFLLLVPLSFLSAQRLTVVQAFPNLLLVEPDGLYAPDDSSNRLFAVEQPGVIKVFDNHPDVRDYGIFLDLRSRVATGGELGLLGLAFDPDFRNNGYFYVDYTTQNPLRTIISRFRVLPDNPSVADSTSETIILSIEQPDIIHHGGQLAFGPDGYLYISTGDCGSSGDPANNAQNRSNLLGKILRIDVKGINPEQPYFIPDDNPFIGSKVARREIYAYGLRNPWRFSFDPPTGRLWCGDVGQDTWEEVNIIEPGNNYGWAVKEGFECFKPAADCDSTGLTSPVWSYKHDPANGYAIMGGFVYRGPTLTSLVGKYIYGDFVSGKIWALDYTNAPVLINTLIADSDISISSFGIDANRELYICSHNGAIYRLAQPAGVEEETAGAGFGLEQSRPNPVASSAAITYQLDRAAHTSLTLHDMLGRPVAVPVDAWQEAGSHTVKLDVTGIPSGAYYYRLESGGRVATRPLIVAR